MDLKDVVVAVHNKAYQADKAYKAGNEEEAKNYLADVRAIIEVYTEQPAPEEGDVTESATSETPAEERAEKPAEVPGAVLPASQFDHGASAQQPGGSLNDEKPGQ